ncbi:hypothetical protein PCIT_a0970 [Pseudoalteromonas citrea]|uniref:CBM6 domain-containing protein n=2 Tax=Pseudoalteromonas citrea TaxID=43655 RepID=A0AAD4ALG5_9GAMM|nr:SUMF1/EgtB/PvdO family nonheme iron enzyme [Pseudoalteromonas citrea]KAF7774512.1 hypothetical protein PCIT_a0970 [Pseudoalteromonas citrea]
MKKITLATLILLYGNRVWAADVIEPPMASIPAGSFTVQTENDESYDVTVPAFQMAKYELTVAEYSRFISDTGYESANNCSHRIDSGWFSGPRDGSWDNNIYRFSEFHPVVCINYDNAVAYTQWLSRKTGKDYRLLSEAQWQYVIESGGLQEYIKAEGKKREQICDVANLADLHAQNMSEKLYGASYTAVYNVENCSDKEVTLAMVGMYKADKYGVHDLVGNANEIMADCYVSDTDKLKSEGVTKTGKECKAFFSKGGAWHWGIQNVLKRSQKNRDFLGAIEGFRIVRDTAGQQLESQEGSTWFVNTLKKEHVKARRVHAQVANYPKQVTDVKLTEFKEKVELSWQLSNDEIQPTYQVFRQDLLNNHKEVIVGSGINGRVTDLDPLPRKARYSVVAYYGDRLSLPSETIDTSAYITHAIPGKIEGEAFSQGTDIEVKNSVQEAKEDRVFASLGLAKAQYKIDVSTAGQYALKPRVYHTGSSKRVEVKLNGRVITSFSTSSEQGWQVVQDVHINLPKGEHTLSLQALEARLSVNWIDIRRL